MTEFCSKADNCPRIKWMQNDDNFNKQLILRECNLCEYETKNLET